MQRGRRMRGLGGRSLVISRRLPSSPHWAWVRGIEGMMKGETRGLKEGRPLAA